MLHRIDDLIKAKDNFAFETTLSTRSYTGRIVKAKNEGYKVVLLFFWLYSPELAIDRVRLRVNEGGHNIPKDIILRRYTRGIINLFELYLSLADEWMIFDNSDVTPVMIAEGITNEKNIHDNNKWLQLNNSFKGR